MAPVLGPRYRDRNELTGGGIVNIISYWPADQKTRWHNAHICLGETRTFTHNRLDLCYSFKMLCLVEYGGTRQLHYAVKNYIWNYPLSAGLHQNLRITYERVLRNLTVLMFSHHIHHLENSGSLEGHRTLMVHECLKVAAAFGRYHRWQCRVSPQERSENSDWNKIPPVGKNNFRHKYSPALTLLGSAQNLAFAHPKLLGCCFDNIYHNGHFIGDLPMRGRPPMEEQTKKIYEQEYEEVVARIENGVDLTNESPSFLVVPTCLVNPDIILPHKLFREQRGLPEVQPGHGPEPREYEMDGAHGLVDLAWSEQTPTYHPDDVDHDPRFTQYPYQEGDDYDDYEEDMETDTRLPGGAGDALMAPPTNTRHTYQHLPATYSKATPETPSSPQSTHTDTDTAMEIEGLSMAPGGPDLRWVTQRTSVLMLEAGAFSTPDLAATVAAAATAAATKILERFTQAPPMDEADRCPVDTSTDAAIQGRFQKRKAATPRPIPSG